jgi:prefoldin subunit 5
MMADKDMITVDDKEYTVEELEQEQQVYVAQLRNINAKMSNLRMDMDQLQAAHETFVKLLTTSLQKDGVANELQ